MFAQFVEIVATSTTNYCIPLAQLAVRIHVVTRLVSRATPPNQKGKGGLVITRTASCSAGMQ